ncbi:hypothetical protein EJ04DRAFT_528593 [Polyplosphaeria fusca]|uniref:Secreted protein n=1 Tax=Polyplosphaeria fusca TaxID=682080 RepID=A0A9P4QPA3_9PLEO|nr:hypothetical protein EJ04DRAFT_528593 [Polyplosphaeria fusca]
MPSTSVAFSGLLASSSIFIIGTDPTAAALCSANWPLLSFTRALAFSPISSRAKSRLPLLAQKCKAVCPLMFLAATSADLERSKAAMASPSLREHDIMSGVQPEASVASMSSLGVWRSNVTMGRWL